jgi:hypothetical protein
MARIRNDLPPHKKQEKPKCQRMKCMKYNKKSALTTPPMSAIVVHSNLNVKLSFALFPKMQQENGNIFPLGLYPAPGGTNAYHFIRMVP